MCVLLAVHVLACGGADPDGAQAFFERYVELVQRYDPALAALYADDAEVSVVLRGVDGRDDIRRHTGAEYREMVPRLFTMAKASGNEVSFTDVSFLDEGDRVRIRATRNASAERRGAPFTLLVGIDASGAWRIVQERTIVKPSP